jgi:putative addiction module component (TIGR02574 family)
MNARREGLVAEVLELPREDRIDLLLELLASLEDREPDPDIEAKWMAEIRRRHAEVIAGTAKLVAWEDVRSRLLGG